MRCTLDEERGSRDSNLSSVFGPGFPAVAVYPVGFEGRAPSMPDSKWLSEGRRRTSLEGRTLRPSLHWPET